MDDRDDAEALSDDDFLGIEPSPNHEVVYQPPMAPPAPDARTIETAKVKIAPDPERAALAKQTTVKILSRRPPPPPQVTPPEVRIAYAKRSRHLFIAAMVLLALAGILGGIYIRKAFESAPPATSSPSPSPSPLPSPVLGSSTSTSTSTRTSTEAPPIPPSATAPPEPAESVPTKPDRDAAPRRPPAPTRSNAAPIGPPVF